MDFEIETAIPKHKWDSIGQDDEPEEIYKNERLAQLAEVMEAHTRMVYDCAKETWDARGLLTTNTKVIFPKAQSGALENDLKVMRAELLHHHM